MSLLMSDLLDVAAERRLLRLEWRELAASEADAASEERRDEKSPVMLEMSLEMLDLKDAMGPPGVAVVVTVLLSVVVVWACGLRVSWRSFGIGVVGDRSGHTAAMAARARRMLGSWNCMMAARYTAN